ncbi:DUF977 family protein [Enterobacter kobei]|uniref:DUF977 family protein n=1 Tax=Enterobacter kobei TaxID=208224 RepID=UPI00079166E6|nr:DUF977 family protein [Enterobacter kobei]SAF46059.1 Bacterial protein of uncharacterised function (DUF977) [Enterobacter kobei]
MKNKSQPGWIQKFIDHTRQHGRLTCAQASEMSGLTRRTLQSYLAEAVELGGLFRTPKQGIFMDKTGYHAWLVEQNKIQALRRERAKEAKEAARDAIKNTPYNPEFNVICRECRKSPAMRRVLSFYGVAQ